MYASPSSLDLAVVTVPSAIVDAILGQVPTLPEVCWPWLSCSGWRRLLGASGASNGFAIAGDTERWRSWSTADHRTEMHRHHLDDSVL